MAWIVCWLVGFAACKSSEPEVVAVEDSEEVCYDNFDNDEDGMTDCLDDGCAVFASCCVGRGLEACCEPLDREFFQSWSSCPGTFEECAPEMTLIGNPQPLLVEGGIAASDTATFPGGAYITEPFDPGGSNLRAVARMALPLCSEECLSYIAFGLSPTPFQVGQFPSFSFAYSIFIQTPQSGIEQGVIFKRNRIIGQFPVSDNEFHNYAIEANASGSVAFLEVDDAGETIRVLLEEFPIDRLELQDPTYVVVAGQQVDATGQDLPGRVSRLYVDRGVCDMPQRAFSEPEPVLIAADISAESIEGVGRAENAAGLEALVLETSDGFHAAESDGSDGYRLVAPGPPELAPSMLPGDIEKITDPWLVADEANRTWTMYFTVWFNAVSSSIASISSTDNFGSDFDISTFAIVAEANFSFPVITDATVAGDRMIVRIATTGRFGSGGVGLLASLRQAPNGSWSTIGPSLEESVIVRPSFRFGDFHSDDVSAPALIEHNGTLRLYYTGKRGIRETIGLVISDTGDGWRNPHGDDALWPLQPGGFDLLGASDPAPIVKDGRVELLYIGFDGVRSSIGRATSGSPFSWPSVNPFP